MTNDSPDDDFDGSAEPGTHGDDSNPAHADEPASAIHDPWKRDRGNRGVRSGHGSTPRNRREAFRDYLRGFPSRLAAGLLEAAGELLFIGIIVAVSVIIYGEVRWPFVAVVFVGSNALLLLVALFIWARRPREK